MTSTVSARVLNPNSFHPVSQVSFHLSTQSFSHHCSLHLLYRLSPSIFVDPYELSQREASYKSIVWGVTELEKPANAVEDSDTKVLLTVAIPPQGEKTAGLEFEVEIPLHGRYLSPSPESAPGTQFRAYRHIPLERPQAFFACPTGPQHNSFTPSMLPAHMSPSQLLDLNMTSTTTRFVSLSYSPNDPVDFVRLPVGRIEHLFRVQLATAAIVLFAFYWVGTAILQAARRLSENRRETDRKKTD